MADPFHRALADGSLDALGAAVAALEAPDRYDRNDPLLPEAVALLDGLLVRVARGRGGLDLEIGARLAALAVGDRVLRLGVSGMGDYARERLGIAPRTAQELARLGTELRARPLLDAAVRRGHLSPRKATVVLPLARGDDEAAWVERARHETVRALEVAVKEARSALGRAEGEEEAVRWERLQLPLEPAQRAVVDEALELAGKLLGPTSTRWERLEAICQESLGSFPGPEPSREPLRTTALPVSPLAAAKAALEAETRRWDFLEPAERLPTVAANGVWRDAAGIPDDPFQLDAELRALVAQRAGWDELLGDLARLFIRYGFWRAAGFASFDQYCAERLGLATRTVEQRAALARRLDEVPSLRTALRAGRLSYEQARLVAEVATEDTAEEWIARAEKTTVVALRREVDALERAQMCAHRELSVRMPAHVTEVVRAAFEGVRSAARRWLTDSECLVAVVSFLPKLAA